VSACRGRSPAPVFRASSRKCRRDGRGVGECVVEVHDREVNPGIGPAVGMLR